MTVTGPAMTVQVREHDKVMEPYTLSARRPDTGTVSTMVPTHSPLVTSTRVQCAGHRDQDGVVRGRAVLVRDRSQRRGAGADYRQPAARSGPLVQRTGGCLRRPETSPGAHRGPGARPATGTDHKRQARRGTCQASPATLLTAIDL